MTRLFKCAPGHGRLLSSGRELKAGCRPLKQYSLSAGGCAVSGAGYGNSPFMVRITVAPQAILRYVGGANARGLNINAIFRMESTGPVLLIKHTGGIPW